MSRLRAAQAQLRALATDARPTGGWQACWLLVHWAGVARRTPPPG